MDFGEFARFLHKEAEQELEVTYSMCREMASYQGAYWCAALPHCPRSIKGGWCEVVYLRQPEGGPPIQEICTYSGWVPERVKRQYMYEQNIPGHMSDVPVIPVEMVAQTFRDYRVWCTAEDQWGASAERPWQHVSGYMAWYTMVSHLKILPPEEESPPRSAN